LLLIGICLLIASLAQAHTLGQSYSVWRLDGNQVEGILNFPLSSVETTAQDLPGSAPALDRLSDHVQQSIRMDGECLPVSADQQTLRRAGFVQYRWVWKCTSVRGVTIDALFPLDARHVHPTRVVFEGQTVHEQLVTNQARSVVFGVSDVSDSRASGPPSGFLGYLLLGVQHIIGGADHLFFLLALLVVVSYRGHSSADAIWMVTGFTIGHSVSLIAASTGFASVDGRLVEALIGLTILIVAMQVFAQDRAKLMVALTAGLCSLGYALTPNLLVWSGLGLFCICYLLAGANHAHRNRSTHLMLAAGFGVIHGFGFAGSLQEIGLPTQSLIPALLGFNLGIEIGQLILLIPAFYALGRVAQRFSSAREVIAGICAAAGIYWFVGRLISA
jgi:hypothetical protein